jgi:hypothetical protein
MNNSAQNSYIWIPTKVASQLTGLSMDTIQRNCKSGTYKARHATKCKRGGKSGAVYEICLDSLPSDTQLKYFNSLPAADKQLSVSVCRDADQNNEGKTLSAMTEFQRSHALKWITILKETENYSRVQLEEYCSVQKLNQLDLKLSISSIYSKRLDFKNFGIAGLSPQWGAGKRGTSKIPEAAFERFTSLFFKERGPGVRSCHYEIFGYMKKLNPSLTWKEFPSPSAFYRLLKNRFSRAEIDFRRMGKSYWERRHEYSITRDWTGLEPNEGLVADNHILDLHIIAEDDKIVRPWLCLFIDLRTSKSMSWKLFCDSPRADYLHHAYALSCLEHGVGKFVLLDNGKDMKAFSGRDKRKAWDDQEQKTTRSLLGVLGVDVMFAREFRANVKPIEQKFQILIQNFCKKLPGYCGSNSASKPETLKKDLKSGNLLTFRECEEQISIFFRELYNNLKSDGRLCHGLSPNQLFESLPRTIRKVTPDGVSFLFMRTSKNMTVHKEGIVDSELGITLQYWSEVLYGLTGLSVYIRRNLKDYATAWVYRADSGAFLCKAELSNAIPGRATTPLEKEALIAAIKRKSESIKRVREATKTKPILDTYEILKNSIVGVKAESACTEVKKAPSNKKQILLTPHDHAVSEHNKQEKIGTFNLSEIMPIPEKKEKLSLFTLEEDRKDFERGLKIA